MRLLGQPNTNTRVRAQPSGAATRTAAEAIISLDLASLASRMHITAATDTHTTPVHTHARTYSFVSDVRIETAPIVPLKLL